MKRSPILIILFEIGDLFNLGAGEGVEPHDLRIEKHLSFYPGIIFVFVANASRSCYNSFIQIIKLEKRKP
jgi:hypothetical protein